MSDTLRKIIGYKAGEVETHRNLRPAANLRAMLRDIAPTRGFYRALQEKRKAGQYGLIAEIKQKSPAHGLIRATFDPVTLAMSYELGGAACLSVLTDGPSFGGHLSHIELARGSTSLPVLRKDFIVDSYQILESRAFGADAVLIIMAALETEKAKAFVFEANELGMDALIEVHDASELERALELDSPLIGINNRNLRTLAVDLATTEALAPTISGDKLVVGESGIRQHQDLLRLAKSGVTTFLVGESLITNADLVAATQALLGARK